MTVITISGVLGSGTAAIAQQVATALGYTLVDKNTTDEILRQYGLTKFEDLYSSAPSLLDLINADNLLIVAMANEIQEALATQGKIVLLGRAGFVVLRDYADVLHVHIQAPLAERVQRLAAREGLNDLQEVEAQLQEDDRVHQLYVRRFYNKDWDDPANYNLVIDTGTVALDAAVQQIVAAARTLEQHPPPEGANTTATIQVDPVLAGAVAEALVKP